MRTSLGPRRLLRTLALCACALSTATAACSGDTIADDDETSDVGPGDTSSITDSRATDSATSDGGGTDTASGADSLNADSLGADSVGTDTAISADTLGTDTARSGDTAGDAVTGRAPVNHRANDSACGGVPPAGSCSGGFGGPGPCTADSDCASGTNGRCVENVGGGARVCFCSYDTCTHDTDCTAGQLCVCHGSAYTSGGNTCTAGDCRVDSDCAGGAGYCSPNRGGGCGALNGYYCHTASDTCVDDSDCTSSSGPKICAYSTTSKHWECTPQLLCP